MKKKKKDKEPTVRERRGALRAELRDNLDLREVRQHRPWTYVNLMTSFRDPNTLEDIEVEIWGVSKISWPDKWDEKHGIDIAIERALAWKVKELLPPIIEVEKMSAEELRLHEHAMKRAQQSLFQGSQW